uniref:RRM domain-containing protein n=1 Tax=Anopheles minimus TaxID=112268 RepID=A0A182WJR0_9DIPT
GLSIPDGGVHIVGGALGDAFIAFSTDEDARQAMSLNGGLIKNGPISLLLSSRAEMQKVIEQARKAALSYMQLKQAAASTAAIVPNAARDLSNVPAALKAGINPKVTPVASLSQLNVPLAGNTLAGGITRTSTVAQQPQPPVISLAGFLAKANVKQQNNATAAPTAASTTAVATVASLSPLLGQGSAYNEIPGLSFLSSDGSQTVEAGVVSPLAGAGTPSTANGALSGWLSALNGASLKGPIVNDVPRPIVVDDPTPWKFLKKERSSRSRSSSRDRSYRRGSRSSSRDREGRRRSRSTSRDRRHKRDGRSRSSSRDRNNRWSRSSSREYSRNRSRNSRSRSPSRDRFGRTRQRSRSRSRDRRSRDSNSRDRYDASNSGRSNRMSRFSDRNESDFNGQQQGHNPINNMYPGMNQTTEPIYGLHTMPGGMVEGGRSRLGTNQPTHFSKVSGKVSPNTFGNGMNGGFGQGGPFRNTSPLPDSVYTNTHKTNNGPTTSDFAVKLSNFEQPTGYGEIRRFFKSHMISTQGIKMINDQHGRRTGIAFIQFLQKEGKKAALLRDGTIMRRTRIRIESITDQDFESAIDSYRPGNDKPSQDPQGWRDARTVNPWNMSQDDSRHPMGDDYRNDEHRKQSSSNGTMAPTTTLVVWNLPSFTTEQDIMKMFSDFTVLEVLIVRNHYTPKQMDGYVKFHRQEDAKEAWNQIHRHFIGNKKVVVRACEEIDYEVAKNEYENPGAENGNSSEQENTSEQPDHNNVPMNNGDSDSANGNNSNGDCNNIRQSRNNSKQSTRWGSVERNWDEPADNNAPVVNMMDSQRRLDGDGGANSDTNSSWNNRDPRLHRDDESGDNGDDSNSNFNNNTMNNNNNPNNRQGNSRDPRKPQNRFGGNAIVDNSEMFQRTNWLLLRNVDFNVYEEDVYAFFGNDGFLAKNVLLVHNERGGRTGECLVEFGSPSEAHHAESKSSQNLGRRKVFASHLDRGQVADLMSRFNAIAQGLQPSYWLPDHLQNNNGNGNNGDERNDDPEKNQGVGCGPYRTSTVGLLNLAYKTSVEDVRNFFQEFNLPLENIRRRFLDNGQPTGEAMVRFQNHQDAEKALNEYQNRRLFGRNVRIRLINDD